MRILLLGSNGQLGKTILQTSPKKIKIISLSKNEFNFLRIDDCLKIVNEIKPNFIINTVAYTNVEKAESEKEIAETINAYTPYQIASEINKFGSKFLHISTDFVFDGKKSSPYKPKEEVNPINEYGKSKVIGERLLIKLENTRIIRTSWLYSPFGKNFCLKMIELLQKFFIEKKPLQVVYDQVSCPTSTYTLSNLCWKLSLDKKGFNEIEKIIHWSDAGIGSWYDFAVAIGEIAFREKIITGIPNIIPVRSTIFPSSVKRPSFSLLDSDQTCKSLKMKRNHWQFELSNVIRKIKVNSKNVKKSIKIN